MADVDSVQDLLRDAFRWTGGDEDESISDPSSWWRSPGLLSAIGGALAELHREERASVVVGIEARGFLLGPLVALRLAVGFAEVRKGVHPEEAAERLLRRTTPPDYQGRSLILTLRPSLIRPADRVLLVDDWIETGGQATAVRDLVEDAGAHWIGVAAIVDATEAGTRRQLNLRALLREQELPWYSRRRR